MALFASYGARTPFLALVAYRRPRNLAFVLAPAALLTSFGILLSSSINDAHVTGALALAFAPALLVGPALVARAGGQRDLAAPLVLGTLVLSALAFSLGGPRFAALASIGPLIGSAFAISAALASGLPEVRDLLMKPVALIGDVAFALLMALAAVGSGPLLDPFSFLLASIVLALGGWSAAVVAMLTRRDVLAAVTGAGTRDPAVAWVLAVYAGGAVAGTVPLAYAVLLALGAGAVALRRLGRG